MEIKVYGSRRQALKGLAGSFVLVALSAVFWQIPATKLNLISLIVSPLIKYGFPVLGLLSGLVSLQTLTGLPLLEVNKRGINRRTLFGLRLTEWPNVLHIRKVTVKNAGQPGAVFLKITTAAKPIVISERLLEISVDELIRRLSEVPQFAARAPDQARAGNQNPAGYFADLAASVKKTKPPKMGWFGGLTLKAVRVLAVLLATFTFFFLKHMRANRPETWAAAMRERSGSIFCDGHGKMLQTCFALSGDECKLAIQRGVDECSAALLRSGQVTDKQTFATKMAYCTQTHYIDANRGRLQKTGECENYVSAFTRFKESEMEAYAEVAAKGLIPKGMLLSSIRVSLQETYCKPNGLVARCGSGISSRECESYIEQATVECERTAASSLPAEIPNSQRNSVLQKLFGCVGSAAINVMEARHVVKAECLRQVASVSSPAAKPH